jgi:hypothetical protein
MTVRAMVPMSLFQRYVMGYIQDATPLVFQQSPVVKSGQLEHARPVSCRISFTDSNLVVDSGKVVVSLSPLGLDAIEWGGVASSGGALKYIVLSFKNATDPVILYASAIETIELWFDGLRLLFFNAPPETRSSREVMAMFARAIAFAAEITGPPKEPEIPPPPSLDYPPAPG